MIPRLSQSHRPKRAGGSGIDQVGWIKTTEGLIDRLLEYSPDRRVGAGLDGGTSLEIVRDVEAAWFQTTFRPVNPPGNAMVSGITGRRDDSNLPL